MSGHKVEDRHFHIEYDIWNILRFHPSMFVQHLSENAGNWESYVPISGMHPDIATGIYKYTTSGQTVRVKTGDWGLHEFHFNPVRQVINVLAVGKNRSGSKNTY